MSLIVFNGSPRGRSGNTALLVEQLLLGHDAVAGAATPVHYLVKRGARPEAVAAFARAETIVLAFPLYVHAMPGIVKHFIDALPPRAAADGAAMGFIVQSGFPEAHHSRWLERYLDRLPARLGCRALGTVVKGGAEGVRLMPRWMNRSLFRRFRLLGERLARTGAWDPRLVRALAAPEDLSAGRLLLLRLAARVGLGNLYWNINLRKHGAHARRFDRPYDAVDPWA